MTVSGICTLTNERFNLALAIDERAGSSQVVVAPVPSEAQSINKQTLWRIIRQHDVFSGATLGNSFFIENVHFKGHFLAYNDEHGHMRCEVNGRRYWRITPSAEGYYFLDDEKTKLSLRAMNKNDLSLNNEGNIARQWDIKAVGGGQYAIISRKYTNYLSASDPSGVKIVSAGIPQRFLWDISHQGNKYLLRSLKFPKYYLEIPSGNNKIIGIHPHPEPWQSGWGVWRMKHHGGQTISLVNESEKNPLDKDGTLVVPYAPEDNPPVNPLIEKRVYSNLTWEKFDAGNIPAQGRWQVSQINPSQGFSRQNIEHVWRFHQGFQRSGFQYVLRKSDVNIDKSRMPILQHYQAFSQQGSTPQDGQGVHEASINGKGYAYTQLHHVSTDDGVEVPSEGLYSGLLSITYENNRLIEQTRLDSEGLKKDTQQMVEALSINQFFAHEAIRRQIDSSVSELRQQILDTAWEGLIPRIDAIVSKAVDAIRVDIAGLQAQIDELKQQH